MTQICYFTATHESGIDEARRIAAEFGIEINELRWFASAHLVETMPGLEEVGSSDVSIHLSHLGNWEPEVLRIEAARIKERNDMLNGLAERTGRTVEQVRADLVALLAPLN
jgi:hypothetical protein